MAGRSAQRTLSRDAGRSDRERRIREIIARRPVGTQEELAATLQELAGDEGGGLNLSDGRGGRGGRAKGVRMTGPGDPGVAAKNGSQFLARLSQRLAHK